MHFYVDPEDFQTMGIRLLAGRFTAANDSPTQVIVDAEFARRVPLAQRRCRWSAVRDGPHETIRPHLRNRGHHLSRAADTTEVPQGGDVDVFHRTLSRDTRLSCTSSGRPRRNVCRTSR